MEGRVGAELAKALLLQAATTSSAISLVRVQYIRISDSVCTVYAMNQFTVHSP